MSDLDPDEVRRLAAECISLTRIAARLHCDRETVKRFACLYDIELPVWRAALLETPFWRANRNRLVALRESGLTSSQIAQAIGTTKNAVIGKLGRMGLLHFEEFVPRQRFVPFPPAGHCVFPFGDVGEPGFGYCADPVREAGQPYCAPHHALCHVGWKNVANAGPS
jgi:DNA-binding CsgD family transcriptional regulator